MSNLLKKASIITTPTAYNDGRILSVKPSENLYGPELVTNGDFSNGTTGWSSTDYNSTLSIVNGQMKIVSTVSLGRVLQAITTEVGKKYLISATTTNINSSTGIQIKVSNGANLDGATYNSEFNATTNPLTITHRFIATATTTYIGSSQGSSVGQSALLDNVSVVEDLSGDFDFSRGSAATRVNAQGLVENVQILSSELVQNGNFSEIGSEEVSNGDFSQEGSELVTGDNSNFDTSTGDWQQFRGVLSWDSSIQAGKWTDNGNSSSPKGFTMSGGVIPTSVGKIYRVKFIAKTNSSSSFNFGWIGETTTFNTVLNPNLTSDFQNYEFTFTTSGNNQRLYIALNNLTIGNGESYWIDNVSVKEVGQDWTIGSGWSISNLGATCSDLNNNLTQDVGVTAGKVYKVTLDVTDYISGTLAIDIGGSANQTATSLGSKTFYFTTTSTGLLRFYGGAFRGTITNISVKEVGQDWGFTSIKLIGTNTFKNTATNGKLQQSYTSIVGAKYRLSFTINSGNWNVVTSTNDNTAGTIKQTGTTSNSGTIEFIATTTTTYILLYNIGASGAEASITNISLLQVTDDTDLPRINYEGFSYQDVLGSELITNGDFAVDGSWVKGTGWTISGGSANGSSTTGDLYQENVVVAGKKYKVTYTISNYVSGSVRVELPNNSYAGTERSANGTYTETILSGGTLVLFDARTSFTGSIDNVSVKEVTGQEVVPNSGCGSWLFEPQSTNLVTYSEDISNSYWTKLGSSVTSGFTSPSGVGNAYKLVEDTSNGLHWMYSGGITVTNATTYNVSVFAKKGERNSIRIAEKSGIAVIVNLESKNFDTIGAGVIDSNITEFVDDWIKIDYSFQTTSTSEEVYIYAADNGNISYQGNGSSGIYVWGVQLEQLSYTTSYIPTNGAASTRLQDIADNSGNSTLINSTEGVLYANISALADDFANYRFISLYDGTYNNFCDIYYGDASNRISARFRSGGGSVINMFFAVSDVTASNKVAISWKANEFKLFINGVSRGLTTSGAAPVGLNRLDFHQVSNSNPFYANVKAIAVFKEALTDAELQALTTI